MMKGHNRYRTIWVSDFHLGTRHTKALYLLDFLRHNESDYLYLVGDIFDGWALAKSWYWPQVYNDVIQKILRKARKGTRIIYIPGNHDEFARGFVDFNFGGIATQTSCIHTTADGRQLLILHGDEFDGSVTGKSAFQRATLSHSFRERIRASASGGPPEPRLLY